MNERPVLNRIVEHPRESLQLSRVRDADPPEEVASTAMRQVAAYQAAVTKGAKLDGVGAKVVVHVIILNMVENEFE